MVSNSRRELLYEKWLHLTIIALNKITLKKRSVFTRRNG